MMCHRGTESTEKCLFFESELESPRTRGFPQPMHFQCIVVELKIKDVKEKQDSENVAPLT